VTIETSLLTGVKRMDVSRLIRQRLGDLGRDQKALAEAAQVTESYISQLLARKKAPPSPGRTDIYEKIGQFLGLPSGELSKLAYDQRQLELKRKLAGPPEPLFNVCRALILRKCEPARRAEVRRVFEKEAFGDLERLVTQKLLDVAQGLAREELHSETWLRLMAQLGGSSYDQLRFAILEFLNADVFHVSSESCLSFLDPMIEAWDIDLKTFGIEVVLNARLKPDSLKRFEFVEIAAEQDTGIEPGLEQFLKDKTLSGDATDEEIEFLKRLRFKRRRPAPLYYYRELQNLRDPLHFPTLS
jgi:transcriptional regulator with XRE-family HTH domain